MCFGAEGSRGVTAVAPSTWAAALRAASRPFACRPPAAVEDDLPLVHLLARRRAL